MKIFMFLSVQIIFLTISFSQKERILFKEDFENITGISWSNWTSISDKDVNRSISNGKLFTETFKKDVQSYTIVYTGNLEEDWDEISFEITNLNAGNFVAQHKISAIYGFTWGFKDWNNYNAIYFSQKYNYSNVLQTCVSVQSVINGNEINHHNWDCIEGLKTGSQIQKVKLVHLNSNSTIRIYFENSYFKNIDIPYIEWQGSNCGIISSTYSNVMFDNFRITQFIPEEIKKIEVQTTPASATFSGNGSGLIISKNGFISTNYHVIENAKKIEVEVTQKGNKKTYPAIVISSDKQNDLAILKIQDSNFQSDNIPFGVRPYGVKVGEEAFALGFPNISQQGSEVKVTNGIISSSTGYQNDATSFQISVPIQPGNSGGPLFDKNGYFIGITNSGITAADNVGYAVKVSYLLALLDIQNYIPALQLNSTLIGKPLPKMVEALTPFTVLVKVYD